LADHYLASRVLTRCGRAMTIGWSALPRKRRRLPLPLRPVPAEISSPSAPRCRGALQPPRAHARETLAVGLGLAARLLRLYLWLLLRLSLLVKDHGVCPLSVRSTRHMASPHHRVLASSRPWRWAAAADCREEGLGVRVC
jgi:hypothetical protein